MELQEFVSEERKIGYETFNMTENQRIRIFVKDGLDILDYKVPSDCTVQISITFVIKA